MNLQTFTSFDGRIPRKTFWLAILVMVVITWILEFIIFGFFGASMMGGMDPGADPDAAAAAAADAMSKMMLPLGIIFLLTLWPSLAIYTKRWHDRNKSGWWSLIMLVPLIGGIWMLVECGFLRGTEGPNRFGEDPLAGM
jgi:uncharacterized membrane protein YhaH (DUF805 family)